MKLDATLDSVRDAVGTGLLAGAVTLAWQHGEIRHVGEIGHRDVHAGLPMQRDTIFRIASMTKPITVAAALTLVDEGRLRLSDPIATWLPEFAEPRVLIDPAGPLDRTVPARRAITVEDLMTHRSGLAYTFVVEPPLRTAYARLSMRTDPGRWLAEIAALPLVHQPGDRLTYGHATDVLGIALERITGQPLSAVLAERILEPLGMPDTGFAVTPAGRRRAATMYQVDAAGTLRDDVMGPASVIPPRFCAGGAGLWSTAEDYLRFARMLLAGGEIDGVRVLSADSVSAMRTDRLTAQQRRDPFLGMPFWHGRGFGLNLSLVTDPAQARPLYGPGGRGSFGWPGVFGTWWQADPENDLILIYLIQNSPDLRTEDTSAAVGGNTALAHLKTARPRFVRAAYQALTG